MKNTLMILGLAVLTLGACKKKGCTDSDAVNYDASAGKDDQSCTFSCTAVFYYTQDTYLNYMLPNSYNTNLEFYVDGTYLGSNGADNSWASSTPPTCSSTGQMILEIDMAGQKSKLFNYEVKDADAGTVVFSGSQVLTANSCNTVLLQQ